MFTPIGGVGDILAISGLIYKIGAGLHGCSTAPSEYQEVAIELKLLDRALIQLFSVEPPQHEVRRIETMRALACSCKLILEDFLKKLQGFESSLGSWPARENRMNALRCRARWSFAFKQDVKALREKLSSQFAAITMLLTTQIIESVQQSDSRLLQQQTLLRDIQSQLRTAAADHTRFLTDQSLLTARVTAQEDQIKQLHNKTDALTNQSRLINDQLQQGTQLLSHVQDQAISDAAKHETLLQEVQSQRCENASTLRIMLRVTSAVSQGLRNTREITRLVKQMLRVVTTSSNDIRNGIMTLLMMFSNIQAQLKKLEQYLPKHTDLPVIRFRDAFGKMRALPYDLSRDWQYFRELVLLIFKGRQGLRRVARGQFFITSARLRRRLEPAFWRNAIEKDDELSMTIILDEVEGSEDVCPFKRCGASISGVDATPRGRFCTNCYRWSTSASRQTRQTSDSLLSRYSVQESGQASTTSHEVGTETNHWEAQVSLNHPLGQTDDQVEDEDIELYHSVQTALLSPEGRVLEGNLSLPLKDRLHIAHVLARSVLQMESTWLTQDIQFMTQDSLELEPSTDGISRPSLSISIDGRPQGDVDIHSIRESGHIPPFVENTALLVLGIALIELSFGKPIETLANLTGRVGSREMHESLYRTAERLNDRICEESGLEYGNAVRKCIGGVLESQGTSSFNDQVSKQEVAEQIVQPLASLLKDWNEMPMDD